MSTTDIPPTEPETKKPKAPASAERAPARRTKITGADLTVDPKKHETAVERSYHYWLGALPGLPVENAHFGGRCFPKIEERVGKAADGTSSRSAVIGAVVRLTADSVIKIRDRISRTVVRWRQESSEEAVERMGTGAGRGVESVTDEQRRRRGHLVLIPTAAEIAAKRAAGRPANLYQPQAGDEPVSRYLFAALCPDQQQPGRGDHYPEPLEVTGLEWPGQLD